MDAGCECAPWVRSAHPSDSWALVIFRTYNESTAVSGNGALPYRICWRRTKSCCWRWCWSRRCTATSGEWPATRRHRRAVRSSPACWVVAECLRSSSPRHRLAARHDLSRRSPSDTLSWQHQHHRLVSVAHWRSARWAWNGYQPGLGSIPRPGRINCFTIICAHALRLISRTGKRVWRCPFCDC